MLHAFQKTSLEFWRKFSKGLMLAVLGLVLSHLVLLYLIFHKEEHWILVPQFDQDQAVSISNKKFSDDYLTAWCDALVRNVLCVNPGTIHERTKDVLNITAPRFVGSLEAQFKKEVLEIRKQGLSTVFYPQKFTIHKNKNEVEVEGIFHTYFGQDKRPVVETKTWIVGWERGSKGVILLTHFQEKKEEK